MANAFFSIFLLLFQCCVAMVDLEELQNLHFDLSIHNVPVLLGRPLEKEVLYVNSKFGQSYECQLPDLSDFEKSQEEERVASEIGISELLKPMEDAPCIKMTQGWWSYEFCYGKDVKQYHMENDLIQGEIIYLGHYESQMDWSNSTHKDAKRHKLNRYHSHTYVNGTECDLNGKARMAEVRFVCSEGEGDAVIRVNEPESCVYIVTVQTTRICHHPYLRPPPSLKARSILCFPALGQMQYTESITKKEDVDETVLQIPNNKIKVKVTKIDVGKKSNVESQTEVYDSDHRKIEDAVQEQLENEGISTDGNVEIKILNFDPREDILRIEDNEEENEDDGMTVLSEEESTYFKNMIFGILNGDAAAKEQTKHRTLESNYKLYYKKKAEFKDEDN
ncbi:protein OS-9-like [Antedon mediterranea]|uniref:protein OS-9-like n=1 Tax=Antedon mediterranea TaxID=105859 RepID=UPI003AF60F61